MASVEACVEIGVEGRGRGSTMYAKSAFTGLLDRLP